MNKLLKLFLIFMLCICVIFPYTIAEAEFTFRSDIHFGDSKDSIKEKEKNTGELEEDDDHLYYSNVTLSNIGGSNLTYAFADGKLKHITISYNTATSSAKATHDYETINDGLKRKYGEPISNETEIIPFPGGLIERTESIFNETRITQQTLLGKNQWIIPIEEGRTLIIEHMALSYIAIVPYVFHILEYQYLEKDQEYESIVDNDL